MIPLYELRRSHTVKYYFLVCLILTHALLTQTFTEEILCVTCSEMSGLNRDSSIVEIEIAPLIL